MLRRHLDGSLIALSTERMRDRAISFSHLNQLRLWVETRPQVPEGDCYKDFGSHAPLEISPKARDSHFPTAPDYGFCFDQT